MFYGVKTLFSDTVDCGFGSNLIAILRKGQFVLYSSLVEKFSWLLIFIFLAHKSSIGTLGIISAIFVFSNILNSVLELGFGIYLQREAAAGSEDFESRLHNILTLKIISVLILFPLSYIYFKGSEHSHIGILFLVLIISSLLNINNMLSRVLNGFSQFRCSFLALIRARGILIFIPVIILYRNTQAELILLFYFFSVLFQFACLWNTLSKLNINFGFRCKPAVIKNILSTSLVMGMGMMFVWLYDRIDVIVIQGILGAEYVSQYSVAYSLYKIPPIFSSILLVPLFSRLSANPGINPNSKGELKKYIMLILLFSCFSIIIFSLFSELFISSIYGQDYAESGRLLKTLSLALPGLLLNNLTGVVLNSIKKEKAVLRSNLTGLVINLSFNCTLLPVIGLSAAVYATIITETSVFLLQAYSLKKVIKGF